MTKTLNVADLPRYDLTSKDVVLFFSDRSFVEGERVFLENIRKNGANVLGVFPVRMLTTGSLWRVSGVQTSTKSSSQCENIL